MPENAPRAVLKTLVATYSCSIGRKYFVNVRSQHADMMRFFSGVTLGLPDRPGGRRGIVARAGRLACRPSAGGA